MVEQDDTASNPMSDAHLPGAGEDDAPYQDDLDTDDSKVDPIMDEETDDPTEELGVPPEEFKRELDDIDVDETTDDKRETMEDMDEDDDNAASAPQ